MIWWIWSLKISIAIFREEIFLLFAGLLLLHRILRLLHQHVLLLLFALLRPHLLLPPLLLLFLLRPFLPLLIFGRFLLTRPRTDVFLWLPWRLHPWGFKLHWLNWIVGFSLITEISQSFTNSLSLLLCVMACIKNSLRYFSWIIFCSVSTLLLGGAPVFLST